MHIAVVGPVYPYRAGIAYCTTRLAEELGRSATVSIVSFSRQYPRRFYPGKSDIDESLRPRTPGNARFTLDIVNPLTWVRTALDLRRMKPDAVIFVWWIWVWALPYLVLLALLPKGTRKIVQCHNVGDKEPARWKSMLTNLVLRRADAAVVHAKSDLDELLLRAPEGRRLRAHLPVHEMGGAAPPRDDARRALGIAGKNVALFFGHIRPYKALDVVLRAWPKLRSDVTLLVAGEAWWDLEKEYRELWRTLSGTTDDGRVRFDFRFVPDTQLATYFAAADVVLVPYRTEAQSGVAMTAFHFGRPVIATPVGGLPEIVRDSRNGYVVPVDDEQALAHAVDRFFTEIDRSSMEQQAREMALERGWPEYAALFARLAGET